jgi:hypothetical protein
MTKLEKVQHYREKAELARQEVLEIVANLPRSEQLYYKIHDLKVDRRQALMCINQPDNPQAIALGLSAEQAREKIKELDTRIGALETERDEALKKEKPKKKRGRPRKLTPNEESEKARQLLQDAFDEAEPDEGELEDLRQKSDRLDRLIKEAKEQQLQKKIEEQERDLRELGIDPDKVVNG